MSPIHIWKLIALLLIHPHLRPCLTHLRLSAISYKLHDEMSQYPSIEVGWELFFMYYPEADKNEAKFNIFFSAGLAVLIALVPGLRAMSTGMESVYYFHLLMACIRLPSRKAWPQMPSWQRRIESLLQANLEVLELYKEGSHYIPDHYSAVQSLYYDARKYVDISRFQGLKHIGMPYYGLPCSPIQHWDSYGEKLDVSKILPASLESIIIYNSSGIRLEYDQWFRELLLSGKEVPNLGRIELRVDRAATKGVNIVFEGSYSGRWQVAHWAAVY